MYVPMQLFKGTFVQTKLKCNKENSFEGIQNFFSSHCCWLYCLKTPYLRWTPAVGGMVVNLTLSLGANSIQTHASSTKISQVIYHANNVLAQSCLTSELEWERVYQTWHDCWQVIQNLEF